MAIAHYPRRRIQTRAATRPGRIYTATDGRDILRNTPDGWEVERPWVWWDGPADGDDGPVWGNPPPGAEYPPFMRSIPPALGKCRQLVADALAGCPWKVFRGTERMPSPDWLSDPQGLRADGRISAEVMKVRHSAVEFWSAFIISMVELGEGIVYVPRRDSSGQPVPPLFLLSPRDVTVDRGAYWVDDTELAPEELIIARNRCWPGTFRGVGIWDQFARTLGFSGTIDQFTDNMLGRGVPSGYLKVNSPDMSQAEATRLKNSWMAAHGGSRKNIAVLNAVTDFKALEMDPQALQLTQLMQLSAWDIATLYGVPPAKLGISLGSGTNLTYANIESQQIDYVQDALLPPARRIESAFDAEFPRGTEMKIVLDGLRRGDTKSRYEAHQIGLEAGFLTKDEVRAYEDLPPLDEDDADEQDQEQEQTVPVQLIRADTGQGQIEEGQG